MHNRHIKMQYATVIAVFLLLSAFSIFASTAIHRFLIRADRVPQYYPIKYCINSILTVEKHRLLFLCFLGFALLLSAALLISYSRNYISKLQRITPKIYTPVAAGQNQYGSARWMKEKDKSKAFATTVINPQNQVFETLIEAGKAEKAIIKKHVVDEEDLKGKKVFKWIFQILKSILKNIFKIIFTKKIRNRIHQFRDKLIKLYFPGTWRKLEQQRIEGELDLIDDYITDVEYEVIEDTEKKNQLKDTGSLAVMRHYKELPEVIALLPAQKGGIVIGMKKKWGGKELIYYISDDTHVLCIGATRSGKSRTLVIQSICNLALAGESIVASDPKGELFQYTCAFLRWLGYNVVVLDFKNPLKSDRYNLLQPIIDAIDDDNIPEATECVWDLVSILVGEAKGEKIWNNGEASTIACAIMSVVYDNREGENRKYQTLTNVYYFIAEMCKPVGKKMPIVEYVKELPDNHPAKPLVAISEIAPERTRGSFYTAALTTLKLFTSSYINAMTKSSDYNPKDLGRKKTALFFVLPDERTTYYSIASVLVLQHYILLVNESDGRGGRLKKRVNFLLDEFGNFATIPNFDTLLTVGGGRGMRFNLFLQDFAQLDKKYDEKVAKTIKGNCQVWDYLQSDNQDTLKELSEKLGKYTVSTYSLSSQSGKNQSSPSSASVNLIGRELLMTDEIKRITRPYSLVTSREEPVIMYSPDLSKWHFNKMLGLGSENHNIKARDYRSKIRPERITKRQAETIELWSECWKYWQKVCEMLQETPAAPAPVRRTIRKDEEYF
jgi:type IV secretion system protein VirD4